MCPAPILTADTHTAQGTAPHRMEPQHCALWHPTPPPLHWAPQFRGARCVEAAASSPPVPCSHLQRALERAVPLRAPAETRRALGLRVQLLQAAAGRGSRHIWRQHQWLGPESGQASGGSPGWHTAGPQAGPVLTQEEACSSPTAAACSRWIRAQPPTRAQVVRAPALQSLNFVSLRKPECSWGVHARGLRAEHPHTSDKRPLAEVPTHRPGYQRGHHPGFMCATGSPDRGLSSAPSGDPRARHTPTLGLSWGSSLASAKGAGQWLHPEVISP